EDGTTGAATLGNLVQLVGVRTFQADHVGGNTGIVAFGSDGGYARGVLDTAAGLSVGDEENDGLLSVGGRILESRCPRDGTVQGGRDGGARALRIGAARLDGGDQLLLVGVRRSGSTRQSSQVDQGLATGLHVALADVATGSGFVAGKEA